MNLRKRNQIRAEVSTSSMNDIMFFLLLFFLITSTLVSPNVIKLLLPNAHSGKSVSKQTITVSVSEKLEYLINSKVVTLNTMEAELKQAIASNNEPTVIVKMDRTVPVQNLVDLLDIGNRLKIKMVLATQTSKQ
jgi:biopolymer transport protein ExbD